MIRSSKLLILVDLAKGAHDGGRVIVPSRPVLVQTKELVGARDAEKEDGGRKKEPQVIVQFSYEQDVHARAAPVLECPHPNQGNSAARH